MDITQGVTSKIEETDTIEMEYLLLPQIDTSVRFMYRIMTPVSMIWMIDGRAYSSQRHPLALEQLMETFAVNQFKQMVLENTKEEALPAEAKWLININKAKVYRCHITRDK